MTGAGQRVRVLQQCQTIRRGQFSRPNRGNQPVKLILLVANTIEPGAARVDLDPSVAGRRGNIGGL